MGILLPSRLPFMLDLFLAVGQTSSLLPRAGWQPLLPAAPVLCSWSCFCRLCRSPVGRCGSAGAARALRSPELALVPAGVSGLSLCCGAEVGAAGLCPVRLPGAQRCVQPHSRAGPQQVLAGCSAACFSWCPELSLPHVFGSPWQSLGRSVVGRGIPHVPVSKPSSSGPRRPPPVAACSRLAVVQGPEFPFRVGSAAGPGSPRSRSEVLALLGRDPRSPEVSPPEASP